MAMMLRAATIAEVVAIEGVPGIGVIVGWFAPAVKPGPASENGGIEGERGVEAKNVEFSAPRRGNSTLCALEATNVEKWTDRPLISTLCALYATNVEGPVRARKTRRCSPPPGLPLNAAVRRRGRPDRVTN
jgi:hypothetical protein